MKIKNQSWYVLIPIIGIAAALAACSKSEPKADTVADVAAKIATKFEEETARARTINCANNLRIILLSFKTWAIDNGDKYPFQVPKASGGSLESCDRSADGFDKNSYVHFLVASNELSSPKYLACPADPDKKAALTFDEFSAKNCTYLVHSVPEMESDLKQVLLYCPIHKISILADSSLKNADGTSFQYPPEHQSPR